MASARLMNVQSVWSLKDNPVRDGGPALERHCQDERDRRCAGLFIAEECGALRRAGVDMAEAQPPVSAQSIRGGENAGCCCASLDFNDPGDVVYALDPACAGLDRDDVDLEPAIRLDAVHQ